MSRFIRGHVIQLLPNNKQASHFAQASGVARLSYNWALKEWQRQYKADKEYRDHVSYTNLLAHETSLHLVCSLILEKKKCFP